MSNGNDTLEALLMAGGAVAWWQSVPGCVVAYAPKGAGSEADSYINLAQPGTYDANPLSAPSWNTSYGWDTTGGKYLDMVWSPADTNVSLFVRFSNGVATTLGRLAGNSTASGLELRPYRSSSFQRIYINGGTLALSAAAVLSGVVGIAGTGAFLDGVGAGTIPAGAQVVRSPYLGCHRATIAPWGAINPFASRIQAVWAADTVLDATQAATLSAAMAAL